MRLNKDFWMSYKGLWTTLIICIVVFSAIYSLTWLFSKPNEAGDTAGLVNGLFSALAFAGVIYAIFLQRNELELQREELKQTRSEFHAQNETLSRQRFENTFFNMLQLQQQIVDNITIRFREGGGSQTAQGRDVFLRTFENITLWLDENSYRGMKSIIRQVGMTGYEQSITVSIYDHYFRHLYRIFKFIATSPLLEKENPEQTEQERYEYASMVRGQLSRYELVWLYYNGLSSNGSEKFKPMIERFSLLKNLREDLLVPDATLPHSYSPLAFSRDI